MNNQVEKLIKMSLFIFVVIFIVRVTVFSNNDGIQTLLTCAGQSIALVTIMIAVYERVLWKFNPFESVPKLSKKYEGTFVSTHDGQTREATLKIKQTLLSIQITMDTQESCSQSIVASITKCLSEPELRFIYTNTPSHAVRDRSEIHYGTAVLRVGDTVELKGEYFTDRKTTGDMTFRAVEE